jgi:hypothetical protein
VMVLLGSICFGVVAFAMFFRNRRMPAHYGVGLVERLSRFANRYGLARETEESPHAYVRRVGHAVGFEAGATEQLARDVETMLYAEPAQQPSELGHVKHGLRRLQFKVALSFR